jgi:glycosyltransferase involved in cell wall biosynthesis
LTFHGVRGLKVTELSQDNRALKVLYCILDNRFGGPHRRAHALSLRLREYNVETLFLTGRKTDDVWQPDDVTVFHLKHLQCFQRRRSLWNLLQFAGWLPYNVLRICRLIRSHGITIVHVDGIVNFVPALAAWWTRTPVVWHYNDYPPRPLRWALLHVVRALADTVIVQGEKLKEARTASDPKLHRKTVVLRSGIDLREFDPSRYDAQAKAELRQEWGVPADRPLIGMIGNMNRFKGHAYFVRAAQRIKEQVKDAKFLVVGRKLNTDPDYWDRMQQLTAACGLQNDLIFTGFREDVAGLLSALDVFVLPSTLESCPNVVLEAMAMRVPVVATDVGAVSELLAGRQTGLLVPSADAEALARAVLECLRMPRQKVEEMVAAARDRVEQVFSLRETAARQNQIYERVVASRRARLSACPAPDP